MDQAPVLAGPCFDLLPFRQDFGEITRVFEGSLSLSSRGLCKTFAPPMEQFRRGRDFAVWLS